MPANTPARIRTGSPAQPWNRRQAHTHFVCQGYLYIKRFARKKNTWLRGTGSTPPQDPTPGFGPGMPAYPPDKAACRACAHCAKGHSIKFKEKKYGLRGMPFPAKASARIRTKPACMEENKKIGQIPCMAYTLCARGNSINFKKKEYYPVGCNCTIQKQYGGRAAHIVPIPEKNIFFAVHKKHGLKRAVIVTNLRMAILRYQKH